MIRDKNTTIEDSFILADSEKFKIMIRVYSDIFVSKDHFSDEVGVGRSTVYGWIQKERSSFNTKSKQKICKAFSLIEKLWIEDFFTEEEFEEYLPQYKKTEPKKEREDIEKHISRNLVKIKENGMKIESLTKDETQTLLETKLIKENSSFMFEFAKKLKSEQRIEEALDVLEWIDERESTFKYKYQNKLRKFKSILLSHDKIKDWDGAIHILRSLYYGSDYHLKDPEILTLLASNYKRKALDDSNFKEEIDMKLLLSALCIYDDAYTLKDDNAKYYDAINLAYLYNIVDAIEVEYADKIEIKTLYQNLSKIWRIDTTNWWEVSSDAEFLMLLGDIDFAISKINSFLENHKVEPFEIDATKRQLELYLRFTDDENAKRFLNYLEESWEILKPI